MARVTLAASPASTGVKLTLSLPRLATSSPARRSLASAITTAPIAGCRARVVTATLPTAPHPPRTTTRLTPRPWHGAAGSSSRFFGVGKEIVDGDGDVGKGARNEHLAWA